jgi:hypothetical protein
MATRLLLTPGSAEFPSSNFPQLTISNTTERRLVLAFDASTQETCAWTVVVPQGITGTITAVISYAMASATTGGVAFEVGVEALTSGDAVDTDAATSYDTTNTGTDAGVPGTAGYMEQLSITLSNVDSWAAGDLARIYLRRAPANATDTATGDALVFAVTIADAA